MVKNPYFFPILSFTNIDLAKMTLKGLVTHPKGIFAENRFDFFQ